MFDATLAFMEHGFMEYVANGKPLKRIGNRHPSITPFDVFQSADLDFVICAGNDHLFLQLCKAIGREELSNDPRFIINQHRLENHEILKDELELALEKMLCSSLVKNTR